MKKQNFKQLIRNCIKEVLNEAESWEPYNAETDTFAPGPRDRLQGEENDLRIPEYPKAIIKKHNMDGKEKWFVYSNSDTNALIIGYGDTNQNAIHNAKTTARFIKHGGVGHAGELKEEHEYDEQKEIKIIKLARDYAIKAKGSSDEKLKQTTLVTIETMLSGLLKMHGLSETIKENNLERPNPDVGLLNWARKRLSKESNKLNVDALHHVIDMLKKELGYEERDSGPDTYPLILRKGGKPIDVG